MTETATGPEKALNTEQKQKFLDEFYEERRKVIARLILDIKFYEQRIGDLGYDEDELRKEKSDLMDKLTKDSKGRVKRTAENEAIMEDVREVEGKINEVVGLKDQKTKTENNLRDFSLYLEVLDKIDNETMKKIDEVYTF